MKNNEIKPKETSSSKSKPNNSTNALSSYLPKDVLEEIDINNSSKTNSLSKNSLSDKSMDKTTKSQTNHNNNNGTSSNGNSNSNSNSNDNNNGKNGNSSGSGSGSNEENNLSSRSLPNKSLRKKKSEQSELAKNLTAKNHSYRQNWNAEMKIEGIQLSMNKFDEINDNDNDNENNIENEINDNENIENKNKTIIEENNERG